MKPSILETAVRFRKRILAVLAVGALGTMSACYGPPPHPEEVSDDDLNSYRQIMSEKENSMDAEAQQNNDAAVPQDDGAAVP